MIQTELPHKVDEHLVTYLHKQHKRLADQLSGHRTDLAIRACMVAREDRRMLALLEKSANLMDQWADREFGRTMRDASTEFALRIPPTDAQVWREAYRCAADKKDAPSYGWLYLSCARYLGLL